METIKCECGGKYNKYYKQAHDKTLKHQNYSLGSGVIKSLINHEQMIYYVNRIKKMDEDMKKYGDDVIIINLPIPSLQPDQQNVIS